MSLKIREILMPANSPFEWNYGRLAADGSVPHIYVYSAYVNAVDANQSPAQPWGCGKRASVGVGRAHSRVAVETGILAGIVRRSLRRSSDVYGYRRAWRGQ